ncbi:hypothetical protein J3R30DRAFT_3287733 [Lentinula aciculospora]|uniref:Vacuolar calcium ion transporter n=1 Tax=Lentinula aciculospora TaxID=153920 RepID=A0A9W9DQ04_9AGAR|nr:hypothetical protein J3R30DRAFT_3287733 [Lentinula aciculospora]
MSALVHDFEAHQDYLPFILSRSSNILILFIFIFMPLLNILFLVFIPLSMISFYLNWNVALRFSFGFLATMNLAKFFNEATAQISDVLDRQHTGLLNASFQNVVKIIVGIVALLQDDIVIAQNIMLGSVLANNLLILGWSFVTAGLKYAESSFSITFAQKCKLKLASMKLMILACISFFDSPIVEFTEFNTDNPKWRNVLIISRVTVVLLLVVYLAYLYFQLKTHGYFLESGSHYLEEQDDEQQDEQQNYKDNKANVVAECLALISAMTTFYVIASIEEFSEQYSIPRTFMSLILVPLVNADAISAVRMAVKGEMNATIDICIGSSIQIVAFVVPLLVIVGWISGHELPLFFGQFETIIIFSSVFLTDTLMKNGKSNYFDGLMLMALYLVIALATSQL